MSGVTRRGGATQIGFIVCTMLLLALCAQRGVSGTLDNDFFWHLCVGEQLQREGVHPLIDDISFASSKEPWTPYSWLAERMMKGIWDLDGLRAAVAAQGALSAALVLFMLLAAVESARHVSDADDESASYLAAIVAGAAMAFIALRYVTLRPVAMAFVIIAACWWLLMRDRRLLRRSRTIWLIPPLLVIGTNMHFFVLIVPAWIGCLLIGTLLDRRWRPEVAQSGLLRLALLLLASLLACAVTPMLPGTVRAVMHYGTADAMVAAGMMTELLPFYTGAAGWLAAVVAALALGAIICRWRAMSAGELLSLALGTALLLRYGRFSPIFAIAACPLLARAISGMSDRALRSRGLAVLASAALVLTLSRTISALPQAGADDAVWLNRPQVGRWVYPAAAARFVEANVPRRSGNIINNLEWGGYLSWRLGHDWRVMVDGRTQLYPAAFWRDTYLGSEDNTRRYFATIDADAAVLKLPVGRFHRVLTSLNWTVAYEDQFTEVLLPPWMPTTRATE